MIKEELVLRVEKDVAKDLLDNHLLSVNQEVKELDRRVKTIEGFLMKPRQDQERLRDRIISVENELDRFVLHAERQDLELKVERLRVESKQAYRMKLSFILGGVVVGIAISLIPEILHKLVKVFTQ